MKKQFTFHDDASHAWLEVSYKDVVDLNIQDRITKCSFINKTTEKIFLEEDCDATLFLNEFKNKYGYKPELLKGRYYEESPIRDLPRYIGWQFNLYWNPLEGKELRDYLNSEVKS